MFLANELRGQIARRSYTQKRLADEMGITDKTLQLKMKTGRFYIDEVQTIMSILAIEDPIPIFFAKGE